MGLRLLQLKLIVQLVRLTLMTRLVLYQYCVIPVVLFCILHNSKKIFSNQDFLLNLLWASFSFAFYLNASAEFTYLSIDQTFDLVSSVMAAIATSSNNRMVMRIHCICLGNNFDSFILLQLVLFFFYFSEIFPLGERMG